MLNGTFKNTDIEQGFYLKELGLFAIDSDTQDEVLFAYVNYGEGAEYINNSISERKEYFYDLVVTVDSADNVTIILNQSSAFITEKELQEALENKADPIISKTITLQANGWVENKTTEKYEYTIEDDGITENHQVKGYGDFETKLVDGYTETYNGSFKIITTQLPEEEVSLDITIEKTVRKGGTQ